MNLILRRSNFKLLAYHFIAFRIRCFKLFYFDEKLEPEIRLKFIITLIILVYRISFVRLKVSLTGYAKSKNGLTKSCFTFRVKD
jgi:hypothetical protein